MKCLLVGVVMATACNFDASGVAVSNDADGSVCGWQYRRTLTFDNAARSEDLVDFPVLVMLTTDRFDYALAATGGADLRFRDPDGSSLAYEIESWTPGGTSHVWVKVPAIDAASSTDSIDMLYGNAAAVDAQDGPAVWSAGYRGVWHGISGAQVADSTGRGNHGTSFGPIAGAGVIGDALQFDGNDDYVEVPDSMSLRLTDLTLEAWVRMSGTIPSGYVTFIEHARETDDWYGLFKTTRGDIFMLLWANTDYLDFNRTVSPDTWYYMAGTLDFTANKAITYVDGAFDRQKTVSLTPTQRAGVVRFGSTSIDTEHLNGSLDEIRISATARSPAWIDAQNASMRDQLIDYGAEQKNCP